MPMIYVKPADGGRVRMPERRSDVMPAEGTWVPRTDYYERLLIGEDIRIVDPSQKSATNAAVAEAAPASTSKEK